VRAGKISKRVMVDRIAWVEAMLNEIRALPLDDDEAFFAGCTSTTRFPGESCIKYALINWAMWNRFWKPTDVG